MSIAEFAEFWWLLPLLLMLVCCVFCGRICSCMRMRYNVGADKQDGNHS